MSLPRWGTCWLIVLLVVAEAQAERIRVPDDHATIQAALDASQPGDVILVAPGTYEGSLVLAPGVTLRSEGDDRMGERGLARAEATILDGRGQADAGGIVMAPGAVLDGFTVTGVGRYDDVLWQRHFDSSGEELGDDEGAVGVEGARPAISIPDVDATVVHCIVHHNGDAGIGVTGAESTGRIEDNLVYRNLGGGIGIASEAAPRVSGNECYENLRAGIGCRGSSPVVSHNQCHHNVRAGIGCREGATPVLRANRCWANRRAGIGIRMPGTAPVVQDNECYENAMAGIGCRDEATPILQRNHCHDNMLAGIGCRAAARPILQDNRCESNQAAGIGVEADAAPIGVGNRTASNAKAGIGLAGAGRVVLVDNHCVDNGLVAIGITGRSEAVLVGNALQRTGGQPPLVAVKDGSHAWLFDNDLDGGGVAGLLVQGTTYLEGNRFQGSAGAGVWVWADSAATVVGNRFRGDGPVLRGDRCRVDARDNEVLRIDASDDRPAFVVTDPVPRAWIVGNRLVGAGPVAQVTEDPPRSVVADNVSQSDPAPQTPDVDADGVPQE